jgi:hypothetical protein
MTGLAGAVASEEAPKRPAEGAYRAAHRNQWWTSWERRQLRRLLSVLHIARKSEYSALIAPHSVNRKQPLVYSTPLFLMCHSTLRLAILYANSS